MTISFLSLGWGTQSFTLAAMMALGDLPQVDVAVHADTGHEIAGTYAHAKAWTPWLEERGLKVVTVQALNLEAVRHDWGKGSVMIPAFTKDRETAKPGQVKRQCTKSWKIRPIRKYIRSLMPKGNLGPGSVQSIQGISLDEWQRMRDSDVAYIVNKYPLVDLRMSRADCVAYLESHGLDIPPKSACTFCPFHSLEYWKQLKKNGGEDWREIVDADRAIRDMRPDHTLYIHPGRVPIEQAIRIPEDVGMSQMEFEFEKPCDGGVCYV